MDSKGLIEMCNKWDRIISEISDVENGENKLRVTSYSVVAKTNDVFFGGNHFATGLSISGVFVFFPFLFERDIFKEKERKR